VTKPLAWAGELNEKEELVEIIENNTATESIDPLLLLRVQCIKFIGLFSVAGRHQTILQMRSPLQWRDRQIPI
jgi:hypothetical protein